MPALIAAAASSQRLKLQASTYYRCLNTSHQCSYVQLRITAWYGGSPAVRELQIFEPVPPPQDRRTVPCTPSPHMEAQEDTRSTLATGGSSPCLLITSQARRDAPVDAERANVCNCRSVQVKGCYISLPSGCPKQPKWWAATEAKIQAANGWYFEDAVMRKTASACAVRDAQFESWCGVSDADVQWVRRPLSPACPRPAAGRTKQHRRTRACTGRELSPQHSRARGVLRPRRDRTDTPHRPRGQGDSLSRETDSHDGAPAPRL